MKASSRSDIRALAVVGSVILLAVLTSPLWAPIPGALVTMAGQALTFDTLADYGLGMVHDSQADAAAAGASIDQDGLRTLCGFVAVIVGGDALRERAVEFLIARQCR